MVASQKTNPPPAAGDKSASGRLHIAAPESEEKLAKKMSQVAQKEKEVLTMRQAAAAGFPHIDLEKFPVSSSALRQIPADTAKELRTVCFYYTQDEIRLGAIDPSAPAAQELLYQVGERARAHAVLYAISEKSFNRVMKLYDTLPVVKAITKDLEIRAEDLKAVQAEVEDFHELQKLLAERSTTDIVTFIFGAGLKLNASDVHIEAEEKKIAVRFRLDGILHDAAELPKEIYKKVVSRLKLVAGLKLNITDKPQDGRFTIKQPDGEVDIRVSAMPTVYGESIVMRLLKQSREGIKLEDIGLAGGAFEKLKHEIERPNGMIIATGPTGSGKTTTLYAIMHLLNEPGVKIITLEDPVEYKMEGVNQSQIDVSRGYTFAKGLRSTLRQDPDIAMVGEIRDLETADIAIQAALTGHLILSTIHTNSAAGAVPRFLSMGVKPFLLAPALNCVIGQRLVRVLCEKCKHKITLPVDIAKRAADVIAAMPESARNSIKGEPLFYDADGCKECHGIGYKGRVGIYEIFIMNSDVEQLILTGQVSEYAIQELAVKNGMITMVQDGIMKAIAGMTSVAEVFRVIE